MSKPRVFFWVACAAHFRELSRVVRLLVRDGRFEPFVYFADTYPGFETDRETIVKLGATTDPAVERPKPGLGFWLRSPFQFTSLTALKPRIKLSWQLFKWKTLLKRIQPRLIVLPEDNVEFETAAIIRAGHDIGVQTIILPYTLANAREPAEALWDHPAHRASGGLTRPVRPEWFHEHRGRKLIRLPMPQILARESLGLSPPKPWILNSGFADRIVVESDAVREYCLAAGLPDDQLRVLGSLRMDDLFRAIENVIEVKNELNLTAHRVILTALPPNQHAVGRSSEFPDYRTLLRAWVAEQTQYPDTAVLINPHPRIPPEDLEGLESEGVRIVRGDIVRLIPLCDLYVASVSATIPLALAAGKPVINYDTYHYHYDDYGSTPLVRTIFDHTSFQSALQAWHRGEFRSPGPQSQWGVLDGQAGHRLMKEFERSCS